MKFDAARVIRVVDESYAVGGRGSPWGERVLAALVSLVDGRAGASFHFSSTYEECRFQIRSITGDTSVAGRGVASPTLSAVTSWRPPGDGAEAFLGRTQGVSAAMTTGLGARLARTAGWRESWGSGVVDSVGVVARDANGDGFCAFAGTRKLNVLDQRSQQLLTRLATHVGAGDRLRRAKHPDLLATAEAVLTPAGRLLHAQRTAATKREVIDDARQRRDFALRSKEDVEKGLEVWTGLVAGRWSLVDHFDTDGKRFLLAVKNAPHVDRRAELTPRERRVCALAASGLRNKEIGYMLGLSISSVAAALNRARHKLSLGSRADLASFWRRLPPDVHEPPG